MDGQRGADASDAREPIRTRSGGLLGILTAGVKQSKSEEE